MLLICVVLYFTGADCYILCISYVFQISGLNPHLCNLRLQQFNPLITKSVTMDKHLRPSRFETEPNATNAEKEWKHWYRTFLNFVEAACPATAPATGADETAIAAAAAQLQSKKLRTLINYVSANIYDFIADAANYTSAIAILENLYVKPRSVIFNRHQLATSKQNAGESIDQFMQNLEKMSKNCEFVDVTGEVYRQEYIRDAFINGISSSAIRQRLLENNTIVTIHAYIHTNNNNYLFVQVYESMEVSLIPTKVVFIVSWVWHDYVTLA